MYLKGMESAKSGGKDGLTIGMTDVAGEFTKTKKITAKSEAPDLGKKQLPH